MKFIIAGLSLFCCGCGYIDSNKVAQDEKVIKDVVNHAITLEPIKQDEPIEPEAQDNSETIDEVSENA